MSSASDLVFSTEKILFSQGCANRHAMDKTALVAQLLEKIQSQRLLARRAEEDARQGAKDLATPQEKREDARHSLEFGALATAHERRSRQLKEDQEDLESLRL